MEVAMTHGLAWMALMVAACLAAPAVAAPLRRDPQPVVSAPARPAEARPAPAGVSERFVDLDAYLAYLEKRSHLDGGWYRQVAPGLYELQTGNLRRTDGAKGRRTFTREELRKTFGFAR
jgi:hypothetical protein